MNDKLLYQIAISLLPFIGPIKARNLISYCGSAEAVFKEKKTNLQKIPGIGQLIANKINLKNVLENAEKELKYIEKNNIKALFYLNPEYPEKLTQHDDTPLIIYSLGNINYNEKKFLSIVGTRAMTRYGQEICEKLITDIANEGFKPVIVSGLAYGIDYTAHTAALKNSLKSIAVLGTGLSTIYPAAHQQTAKKLTENGALISEFPFKSKIDPYNFVKRNRIIAALSEATIIIESPQKGGSLITAEYAIKYARDVYAFPGKTTDKTSKGCNFLIKTNRAALIENASDLIYNLQWEKNQKKQIQTQIFVELSEIEKNIVEIIKNNNIINVDVIAYKTKLPINTVLSTLFNLEFKNIIKALPGRMYTATS